MTYYCSNEWKFAAAVPVVDIYPRHTRFRHIEYPSYTGVAVLEMNFERIDINQVVFTQPRANQFVHSCI